MTSDTPTNAAAPADLRLEALDPDLQDGDDYLWDGSGAPDEAIAELEELMAELRFDPQAAVPQIPATPKAPKLWRPWLLAAAVLGVVGAAWLLSSAGGQAEAPLATQLDEAAQRIDGVAQRPSALAPAPVAASDGWALETLGGLPTCDGAPVADGSRLRVGGWLETDAASSAKLTVAELGTVEVSPGTRLRLKRDGADGRLLELERGGIAVQLDAPAGHFIVETPLATAVDLGCAYTLLLQDDALSLQVTSGKVALQRAGISSFVPAGARADVSRAGLSVPYFEDASEAFREALVAVERDPSTALTGLLRAARPRDTLSLWHLLARTEEARRTTVLARMQALGASVAPNQQDALLAADRAALEALRDAIVPLWSTTARTPIAAPRLRQPAQPQPDQPQPDQPQPAQPQPAQPQPAQPPRAPLQYAPPPHTLPQPDQPQPAPDDGKRETWGKRAPEPPPPSRDTWSP